MTKRFSKADKFVGCLTQLVKIHAVVLGTGLVLHEVRAVLRRAQRGLQGATVDEDVVDGLKINVSHPIIKHLQLGLYSKNSLQLFVCRITELREVF
jgi:hypothetical protein